MKPKLTPHKIAQVDRLMRFNPDTPVNTENRLIARFKQGEAFGHNADSRRYHGYVGAWYEVVKRNLQTA